MKQFKIGLQLYSIRDEMAKDVDKTLKAVKDMGYDYVEFAGYFGHSAKEIKDMLDKHGLECVSVHQGYNVFLEDEQKNIEFLKGIGAKQCAIPWMGKEKHAGSDVFAQTVKDYIKVGTALKNAGINFAYHNHEFELELFEDKFLLDWLFESIPADLLQTQIDTCWVKYAGYDPAEYILKYSGRCPTIHLKDFVCKNFASGSVYALIDDEGKENKKNTREDNGFEYRPLGQGVQDFKSILEAAEKAGVEYLIVEQDGWPTAPQMQSVEESRQYLRTLGL